jgi:poly-gamma-glutamate capsule biosynthesis protein CapA/YwtB (metallophosphatase superfamily)
MATAPNGTAFWKPDTLPSVTSSDDYWPDKEVLYRMHPQNIGSLTAARIDCCCLANNHVLDWGYPGLRETLRTLDTAGVAGVGAGHNVGEAAAPAVLNIAGRCRVLVFAFGSPTSGIPREWTATDDGPGVNLVEDLSRETARPIAARMRQLRQAGDVTVASIHWGGNWGYEIPDAQIDFAHQLIEEGVDVVHGHSSHHVKAMEVYRERLILYGCGDFLTDYEGISGYQHFRRDLALMYLVKVDPRDGRLMEARLVPLQSRRFRLTHAKMADAQWLCGLLNRVGARFSTRVQLEADNSLVLRWHHGRLVEDHFGRQNSSRGVG